MKTLAKVAIEMALSVLAHNLTRVMNIVGIKRQQKKNTFGRWLSRSPKARMMQ
jgi:hypothetical protein